MKRTLILLPILLLSLLCAAHAQLMMMGVGPGGASGGGPVPGNIFVANPALNADDANNQTSFRIVGLLSASSTGTIKISIQPGSVDALTIGHASFCKWDGTPGNANCAGGATPLEATFAGGSGFSGETTLQTSDAINHSASFSLNAGDYVVVIYDTQNLGANQASQRFNNAAVNATTFYKVAATSWNQGTVTGFTQLSNVNYAVAAVVAQ